MLQVVDKEMERRGLSASEANRTLKALQFRKRSMAFKEPRFQEGDRAIAI